MDRLRNINERKSPMNIGALFLSSLVSTLHKKGCLIFVENARDCIFAVREKKSCQVLSQYGRRGSIRYLLTGLYVSRKEVKESSKKIW